MKRVLKSNRKLIPAIISAISCAAILLTGTFAWLNTVQARTNEFGGNGTNPGGSLHDDFEEPNKDVYVENWGDAPIFARIRLDEYMELGNGAGKRDDNGLKSDENEAVPLIQDSVIDDKATWTPHAPGGSTEICEEAFHDYWAWKLGGGKFYKPVSEENQKHDYIASDTAVYDGSETGVKKTLDAEVMTMAQWIERGQEIGAYWVIDADGWAYWAAPIEPDTATGLLLDSVTLKREIGSPYFYAINVVLQMASLMKDENGENWENFEDDKNGGWTEDGEDLMEIITGGKSDEPTEPPKEPEEAPQIPGGVTVKKTYGEIIPNGSELVLSKAFGAGPRWENFTATVEGENISDKVSWTVTGTDGVKITEESDTEGEILFPAEIWGRATVTVKAVEDESKWAQFTVFVPPYDIFYSEGGTTLSYNSAEETGYGITVNLTSPVGAETKRWIDTDSYISDDKWVLTDTDPDKDAAVARESSTARAVTFPEGFIGSATLTVAGYYNITFNVTPAAEPSAALKAGETFESSGIEWRVLHNTGAEAVVIAEHVLEAREMHSVQKGWDTSIRWRGSELREYLNGEFYDGLDDALKQKILDVTVYTKTKFNGDEYDELAEQKVFLLSEEETFGSARKGANDQSKNIVPNTVLFADDYARMGTQLPIQRKSGGDMVVEHRWLRSPGGAGLPMTVSRVSGRAGSGNSPYDGTIGVRPAMKIALG
jgi:hypothetical protein